MNIFSKLFELIGHEHKFMLVGTEEVITTGGINTTYAILICAHPLCNSLDHFPSTNREIAEQWEKEGVVAEAKFE